MISIRMTEEEENLARAYSKLKGTTLSEAIKSAFFEKIYDEYDVKIAEEAYEKYKNNPKTYTLEEVKKELGF